MRFTSIKIVTPGRIILHCFLLLIVLFHGFSSVMGMLDHANLQSQNAHDVEAQRRAISRRIGAQEDQIQVLFLPEGPFLTNIFYGSALVNLCLQRPEDTAMRTRTLSELERIFEKVKIFKERIPFNQTDKSLPGGIIYAGNLNRLMAGYILLGGRSAVVISEFHANSENISKAFLKADPPFPESFGGLTWPVDGVPALDSLRLHDLLYDTQYFKVSERWLSWLKGHIDSETGLMIAQAGVTPDSPIVDGTRGCAMSWTLALLPSIDPEFSRQQYKIFREQWFVPFGWGLLGIQEWFRGKERRSDFKPGPVVGGLGAAATGLGIAAARANSDWSSWNQFLRGLELFGAPLNTLYGEKSYFFGLTLMCDSIALWGKTIVPWDKQALSQWHSPYPVPASDSLTVTIVLVLAIILLVAGLLIYRIVSMLRKMEYTRVFGTRLSLSIGCAQGALAAAWLFTPIFSWMQIAILAGIIDLLEEMAIRPRIVAQIFREREQESA